MLSMSLTIPALADWLYQIPDSFIETLLEFSSPVDVHGRQARIRGAVQEGDLTFSCEQCNKKFDNKQSLLAHSRSKRNYRIPARMQVVDNTCRDATLPSRQSDMHNCAGRIRSVLNLALTVLLLSEYRPGLIA